MRKSVIDLVAEETPEYRVQVNEEVFSLVEEARNGSKKRGHERVESSKTATPQVPNGGIIKRRKVKVPMK